jgi:hypothetical protein
LVDGDIESLAADESRRDRDRVARQSGGPGVDAQNHRGRGPDIEELDAEEVAENLQIDELRARDSGSLDRDRRRRLDDRLIVLRRTAECETLVDRAAAVATATLAPRLQKPVQEEVCHG